MSKDPAFLFYSSDFLTGTLLMTMEQKGKYITLLCIQHQKGHIPEKDMMQICGAYDEDIFLKFQKDNEGKFYNTRLEEESDKRKAYSESRRNNRKKKEDVNNISLSYVKHMENENENENEIKNNKVQYFKKPSVQQIKEYMRELNMEDVSSRFVDYYDSNGWKVGKNAMKDWKATVRNWNKKTETRPTIEWINMKDYE